MMDLLKSFCGWCSLRYVKDDRPICALVPADWNGNYDSIRITGHLHYIKSYAFSETPRIIKAPSFFKMALWLVLVRPMKMLFKHALLAASFIVSWQEYELKPAWTDLTTPNGDGVSIRGTMWDAYTVETVNHSIKLKTQKDVDLFVPRHKTRDGYERDASDALRGLLPSSAFNVNIQERKP